MSAESIEQLPSTDNRKISKLVDSLLTKAIEDEATAISVESHRDGTRVRYRRQGQWQMMMPVLAGAATKSIGSYLQEIGITGSFDRQHGGLNYRFHLSVWSTVAGEKFNLTISHRHSSALPLDRLFTDPASLQKVQSLLGGGRGLLLVLANKDSGKSSTIAALLQQQVSEAKNILWLSNPAKYNLEGVSILEMPKNEAKSAVLLQSCLQSAPDILAFDHLADGSTAKILFQQAADQLVIASMVADSPGMALNQLIEWGVSIDLISGSLLGVIHQKLLNVLCPRCRIAAEPQLEDFNRLGLARPIPGQYYQANTLTFEQCEERLQQRRLCISCHGSGYQGRMALSAIIPMQAQLKALLQRQSDSEEIDLSLREDGVFSLFDRALPLAAMGHVSLTEVQKCLRPSSIGQLDRCPDNQVLAMNLEPAAATNDRALQEELDNCNQKCQQLLTEILDYQEREESFEQRLRQSRQQAEQGTKVEIALQIISVIDVVELARSSIRPQSDREAAIQKGYTMLENKLISTLRDMGVHSIDTQDRQFDSHWHEVIEEEVSNKSAGIILAERKRGFILDDRVLRLAQVKVAVRSSFL
jgi:type II secretory ATPase GspE/PulE/Tfp pilus assembly ATPase PilB-like protein/molecular chaperone GrpE (heat shock protein)